MKLKIMRVRFNALGYAIRSIPRSFQQSYKRYFTAFVVVELATGAVIELSKILATAKPAFEPGGIVIDKSIPGEAVMPLTDKAFEVMKEAMAK